MNRPLPASGKKRRRFLFREAADPVFVAAAIAALDGIVAALLFLGVAGAYHFFVLNVEAFNWAFYGTLASILGLLFAAFALNSTSRFLEGDRRNVVTASSVFLQWTASCAVTLLVAFLTGVANDLSRVSLTAAYVAGVPALIGWRSLVRSLLLTRIGNGELRYQKIAVIGECATALSFLLSGDFWRHGQSIVGTLFLEDVGQSDQSRNEIREFVAKAIRSEAQYIVIVGEVGGITAMNRIAEITRRFSVNIVFALVNDQKNFEFLDVVTIGSSKTLRIAKEPLGMASLFLKRSIDIAGAALGLLLLSPLFAFLAAAIRLESPGPAIYRQERVGFNGEPFTIFKFRSMTVQESGHAMRQAERGDKRITRIGRFLRATSLDELPQLINVLRGQMSLVGPRPHAISHDDEMSRHLADYAFRQRIKPGITGWAQVNGYRGETSTLEQMRARMRHDLDYIDNWSPLLDLWILFLTVFAPSAHRNAY